jgi:hypothetical protein
LDIQNLRPGTYLKLSQIVSVLPGKKDKDRIPRVGLVPMGRSTWLKLIKQGKIPKGRQLDPSASTSPKVWTIEEVQGVLDWIKNNEAVS